MNEFRATLYFDGGIRKKLMAYGYLAVDPKNDSIEFFNGFNTCGVGTSNVAEYRSLIAGLERCVKEGVKIVHIIGDSQLIIKQVLGSMKVHKQELKDHRDHVLRTLEKFDNWTIKWVPRKENHRADALVNKVFERKWPNARRTKG